MRSKTGEELEQQQTDSGGNKGRKAISTRQIARDQTMNTERHTDRQAGTQRTNKRTSRSMHAQAADSEVQFRRDIDTSTVIGISRNKLLGVGVSLSKHLMSSPASLPHVEKGVTRSAPVFHPPLKRVQPTMARQSEAHRHTSVSEICF